MKISMEYQIEEILSSLKHLKFATRKQLHAIHNLKGIRNAQRILKSMVDERLLSVTKLSSEHIYYLTKRGAERVDGKVPKLNIKVYHHLLRTDAWLTLNRPEGWQIESKINVQLENGKNLIVVPDALYVTDTLYCVEIDHTQSMAKNRIKLYNYKVLSELYYEQTKKKPIIQFFTTLESRKDKLIKMAEDNFLIFQVFVLEFPPNVIH